jgi:tRNA(fMet)-specific endonuclease VapC
MKPTLLDTDILSHLVRRNPLALVQAQQYIEANGALQFSIITYYEVLNGLLYRDARQQMGQFQVLTKLHSVLPLTKESVDISARIEADLRRRGLGIGATDTLIAGVAIANGLVLATHNTRHFERIEGLELTDWVQ